MGEVFVAEDENLRRKVAIKFLRNGMADPASRRRFEREAPGRIGSQPSQHLHHFRGRRTR